ncbi:MAG: hypothetical protein AMJ88_14575 [Anaerolineae bacterium SM23_ 63]|nr:MAG: hypothetical protein AMJ88_14575 [Anaerolineae bacterium SM23_ 63]
MKYLQSFPLHHVFFAAYPVIALLAHNIEQVRPSQAQRALVVAVVGSIACFLFLKLLLREWRKAALGCTVFVVMFFSYGHIYDLLRQLGGLAEAIGRHRYLLPIWLLAFGIGLWWIRSRLRDVTLITLALNIAAVATVVLPTIRIVVFEARFQAVQSSTVKQDIGECDVSIDPEATPPDVYYIILDAYTSGDTLRDVYGFDNSAFLDNLREMGFYIAPGSQSNYGVTGLSLSASFNMNYLDKLDESFSQPDTADWMPLWPLLTRGIARRNLECLGYKVITFDTGYYWSGWRDADVFFDPSSTALTKFERAGGVNAFESMLIESSAGLVITDAATLMPDFLKQAIEGPYREHRALILYQLDSLEKVVPGLEGPKFVFAHILVPHPPFVFGADGEEVDQSGAFTLGGTNEEMPFEERAAMYIGQVKFINQRISLIVEEILERSEPPPIIILQGDHGLDGPLSSQMAILNAYYLPEGGDQHLYETVSPVNTFRIIFDHYFGGSYGLIEDISYYSRHVDPFNFILVPNEFSTHE